VKLQVRRKMGMAECENNEMKRSEEKILEELISLIFG
jgi:hypothetical protein